MTATIARGASAGNGPVIRRPEGQHEPDWWTC